MPNIRIEFVPIRRYNLGWFGFDHLQLTYEPDEIPLLATQDDWFVLEGNFDTTATGLLLGVQGTEGNLRLSTANLASGDDLIAAIGTPMDRGSRILPVPFDLIGNWLRMADYGAGIQASDFPYIAYGAPATPYPTFNSSSVIASLLWQIGIDVNVNMPYNVRFSPGTGTLLGTNEANELSLPTDNFNTIGGGYGDDIIRGSNSSSRVDKLFGGGDNDTFYWSTGFNIINGGEPRLAIENDGEDTINYEGAGTISIAAVRYRIPGFSPEYTASFTGSGNGGGTDWWYSIERVTINNTSDTLVLGEGVALIRDNLAINLLNEDSGGQGDRIEFTDAEAGLLVRASASNEVVVTLGDSGSSNGWWLTDAEWIAGSGYDDEIYLSAEMFGAEGGEGNDILDARGVLVDTGASPEGYDVELAGDEGTNRIISGAGRTLALGGSGTNDFILSSLGSENVVTEFVIENASSTDRIFVPIDLFNGAFGPAAGSDLLQLRGAAVNFADISTLDGGAAEFRFRTNAQIASSPDQTAGVISFVGEILYYREGSDLLIQLTAGSRETSEQADPEGIPFTLISAQLDPLQSAIIRIVNFQPGMLGLTFVGPTPTEQELPSVFGGVHIVEGGLDAIVNNLTNGGILFPGFDELPVGPTRPQNDPALRPQPAVVIGTVDVDTLNTSISDVNTNVASGEGDDTIQTGAGDDRLDGGTGNDTMTGGAGNDVYVVDQSSDTVIEQVGGGLDEVIASATYTLSAHVEDLTLTGEANDGTGNANDNTIVGNARNNTLTGGAGDDALYGKGGTDILVGGDGADGYFYFVNDGSITIVDTGPNAQTDVLILSGGITPAQVRAYRLASAPNDLILQFEDGGAVTLQGYFLGHGVERIEFDNTAVWNAADIAAVATAAPTLNAAPTRAIDDQAIGIYGSTVIPSLAFLINDFAGSGTVQITSVSNPSVGSVALDANGDVVVDIPPGYEGDLTFLYTIADSQGITSTAQATVSVSPLVGDNAAPVTAATINLAATEDQAAAASIIATDPDGDTLFFSLKPGFSPLKGTVVFGPDGTYTYQPTLNATGTDTFTLIVSDGFGGRAEQVVNVTIAAVNDAPTAIADPTLILSRNVPLTVSATSLITNDFDVDGDQLSLSSVSNATNGQVTLANGQITFVPMRGYSGSASFDYTISDGNGGTTTATAALQIVIPPNLTLTGTPSANTLAGGDGDDVLSGLASADSLSGGYGNDTLDGGTGIDIITGGDGDDIYFVDNVADAVIETNSDRVSGGFDIVIATADTTLSANVEQLVLRDGATSGTGNADNNILYGLDSSLALTLDGGAGDDVIYGSTAGSNTLIGGEGGDTLLAYGGRNTLSGGRGNDIYYTYTASDILSEAGGDGIDTVYANHNITLGDGFDQIILFGSATNATSTSLTQNTVIYGNSTTGPVTLDGGGGDDLLLSGAFDDTLIGGAGADRLYGLGGANTLVGGDGNDVYYAQTATNTIIEAATGGFDTLYSNVNIALLATNVEQLILYDGATSGTGNADANLLFGHIQTQAVNLDGAAGDDYLLGSAFDDRLIGGTGNDQLDIRNGGNDTLAIGAAGSGLDRIYGFDSDASGGQDLIDVAGRNLSAADIGGAIMISASGANTVIAIATDTITLLGVDHLTVSATDFKF